MLKKFFGKKKENSDDNNILTSALLVHAAKIDENYTENEKQIIIKALVNLNSISLSATA